MIERIAAMPPGTVGLRASGTLTKEDYEEGIEPAIKEGIEAGELRLLFVLTSFEGLGHGAWVEDMKTGFNAWVREHSAWRRFALVTDVEWVAKAMRAFAWLAPGEARVFGLGEEDEARAWVAG